MDIGGVEELQHAVVFRRKILAGSGAWRRSIMDAAIRHACYDPPPI